MTADPFTLVWLPSGHWTLSCSLSSASSHYSRAQTLAGLDLGHVLDFGIILPLMLPCHSLTSWADGWRGGGRTLSPQDADFYGHWFCLWLLQAPQVCWVLRALAFGE